MIIFVGRKTHNMKIKIFISIFVSFASLLVISCRNDHYKINTHGINVEIKIRRLEKDLFSLDPAGIKDKLPDLKKEYDGFLQLFSYVINTGEINDPGWPEYLAAFCTDKTNNEVYAKTIKIFPDVNEIESGLKDAMIRYIYYFPDKVVPLFYTCITGFNNSIIVGDSVLGVSLDMYLGADCAYYPKLGYYDYQCARMTASHIIPNCIYAWASTEWDFKNMRYQTDNTLSEMIHEGKLMYVTKCILADTEENFLFGFTNEQMQFCLNNERLMWQYLIEHDLLFDTDQFTIRKLTGEAPFTSYFTNQSPGKAGVWLGFRIVESYMSENPGITLEDLMKNTDFHKILEDSKYSPK
jgi:hypothetical protein